MENTSFVFEYRIKAEIGEAFGYFLAADLCDMFPSSLLLSGIAAVHPQKPRLRPGDQRTIFFKNGNAARCTLKVILTDMVIVQRVDDFTGGWARIMQGIIITTAFKCDGDSTILKVTAQFIPANPLSARFVNSFMKSHLRRYFQRAFKKAAAGINKQTS
jgi:hypothetical protein